ncbi:rCG39198 [Rattus norvegicus]|uniref:RCG39198 n=1 Tax=Rattus norvegicus TaxID=10116 RepID=A6KMH7_RAT|nr:rCG39198 [Rattus norvegicus]
MGPQDPRLTCPDPVQLRAWSSGGTLHPTPHANTPQVQTARRDPHAPGTRDRDTELG